jgi:hypothetical protein
MNSDRVSISSRSTLCGNYSTAGNPQRASWGRIIDESIGAARALGMMQSGLILVSIG